MFEGIRAKLKLCLSSTFTQVQGLYTLAWCKECLSMYCATRLQVRCGPVFKLEQSRNSPQSFSLDKCLPSWVPSPSNSYPSIMLFRGASRGLARQVHPDRDAEEERQRQQDGGAQGHYVFQNGAHSALTLRQSAAPPSCSLQLAVATATRGPHLLPTLPLTAPGTPVT